MNAIKKKLFPSRKIDSAMLVMVKNMLEYTPDLAYLQQFERQFLFVPDNMMTGHIDHDRLYHEELIYPTAFTRDAFSMVYKPLGIESYPIALEVSAKAEDKKGWADPNRLTVRDKQARIRGQVWSIFPDLFKVLDKVRENGVVFDRKRVVVDIPLRRTQEGSTVYRVSNTDTQWWMKRDGETKEYWTIPSGGASLHIYTKKMWMYVGREDYWKDMTCDRGFELPSVRIMRPRSPLLKDYFYWLRSGDHNK
jgi:hypothetical protein